MADKFPPQEVAEAFVKQYYMILNKCPENAHKFYKEPSVLGWPGPDGVMTNVTTSNGISDKIMSEDYKNCMVEVKTTDAQKSLDGAVIVHVTGYSTGTNNVKMNFSQTFFLAKQEKGFYVLNDILRFSEPITNTAAKDDDEPNDDQPAPVEQNSAPRDIPDSPPSPKAVVENGDVNEDSFPVLQKPVAKQASPKPPVVCALAANVEVVAKQDSPKPPVVCAVAANVEVVAKQASAKPPVVCAMAANVKEEPKKITYASMVAKETPLPAPRTAPVSSPKAKSSAQLSDGAPKVSSPSRAPAALSKAAPKLASPSDGAPKVSSPSRAPVAVSKAARKLATPNNGPYAEARGIYIGRLPYEITKQGIVEVIKQFGPVRRTADNIQIRKHDDGFVCGFLEFESAESARRAVETHYVYFGDKEAYITYRRSAYGGGKGGRGKSPSRIGVGNGRGNGASNKKGPARSPRRR